MSKKSDFILSRSRRRAFTLVELLVVIAIIGMLVAMLLPAVQSARAAARRVSCCNNLRQIGTGLLLYHDVHNSFPPGSFDHGGYAYKNGKFVFWKGCKIAWSALILPFMEHKPIYDRIDLHKPYDSPENAHAASQVLPIYLCPSNPRTEFLIQGLAVTDYGGIYGEQIVSETNFNNGVFIYNASFSIRDITDGTSTTLIVSEDNLSSDMKWISGYNIFMQRDRINGPELSDNEIRSCHIGGGAHGLFGDGSVRFLSESMACPTLAAICTRDHGEVVEPF